MFRHALTHRKAVSLEKGKYADGHGLWLSKTRKGAGHWFLRFTINGRRREMGFGPWPDVTITEARERAYDARRSVRDGNDPIEERRVKRYGKRSVSLRKAIELCFEARQAQLKGNGEAGRWMSPLQTHVIPKAGHVPIENVDQHEIVRILKPIWHTKPSAAEKALNRISLTIQHAAAMGLDIDMQAAKKARALLGKQRHKIEHIPSLPYAEMPDFYSWLKKKETRTALALRFLILTVARTSEIRFATFEEIEGDAWILPEHRTKNGRLHRIPLVTEAQDIIERAKHNAFSELLFPRANGNPFSDAAMSMFMKREGFKARPHGFRASFRTWVEEQTDASFEVKEACLGHAVDSKVVEAYQRSDRFEKRRSLLNQWEKFLARKMD